VYNKLFSKFFGIALAIIPFGAIYWPEFLGSLASSPAVPLLLILGLIRIFTHPAKDYMARLAKILIIWGLANSVFSLLIFGWSFLYFSKLGSHFLLAIAWLSPFLCIERVSERHLKRGVYFGVLVLAIGYFFSDIWVDFLNTNIRGFLFYNEYGELDDGRARGFNSESSHFAANVGRYFFIAFLMIEHKKEYSRNRLISFLCFLAICLILTSSKGAAISIGLVIIMVLISGKAIGFSLLLLPLLYYIAETQLDNIIFDIENFTSTSTRVSMYFASIWSLLINPFGYGYYGFYGVMSMFGSKTLELMFGMPLLMGEFNFIVNELKNVSFKSTFLDFAVIFGVPFFYFIYKITCRIKVSDMRARAGLIYFFLSSLSVEGYNSITFSLGIAVLFLNYPRYEKN